MLGLVAPRTTMAGYYRMEGNSNDSSGNGNNGTDTSMTYNLASGKFGQGASGDGTLGFFSANGLLTTLATSTTGTISFWAKNLEVVNTQCFSQVCQSVAFTSNIYISFDWRTGVKRMNIICQVDGTVQWNLLTAVNSLTTLQGVYRNYVLEVIIETSKIWSANEIRKYYTQGRGFYKG